MTNLLFLGIYPRAKKKLITDSELVLRRKGEKELFKS